MNDPLPTRAAARDAAREAAENVLPPETPPTFADAWSGLIAAIGSAQATEDISDHAAEELLKDADELLGAYREGDTDRVGESLQHLDEHLAKAVEDEEISPAAADAVETSISDLVVALQDEGALDSAPTGPTGDEQGSDEHGGSPPYGEAKGHED
jgi:endonuclease III